MVTILYAYEEPTCSVNYSFFLPPVKLIIIVNIFIDSFIDMSAVALTTSINLPRLP